MSFALRSIRWLIWGKRIPRKIVFAVGLYTIFNPLYDMFDSPIRHQLQDPVDISQYGKGSVAVITGATNPTGLAFAERLSRAGFKLIFVADQDDEANKKLQETYPGSALMVFDFAGTSEAADYVHLCSEINQKAKELGSEITVLVNNVQKMDSGVGKLHKTSDDEIVRTINANTCPAIYMTRILGQEMEQRGNKCAVINMSSYYSKWEAHQLPIFCAGSAFTSYFSQVVGYENPNMDILTVLGMPVKSERNPRGVDPNELVDGVMRDLGRSRISYGHWRHSLFRHYILAQQCQRLMGRNQRGRKHERML